MAPNNSINITQPVRNMPRRQSTRNSRVIDWLSFDLTPPSVAEEAFAGCGSRVAMSNVEI